MQKNVFFFVVIAEKMVNLGKKWHFLAKNVIFRQNWGGFYL
jgi:hypothetical protein